MIVLALKDLPKSVNFWSNCDTHHLMYFTILKFMRSYFLPDRLTIELRLLRIRFVLRGVLGSDPPTKRPYEYID